MEPTGAYYFGSTDMVWSTRKEPNVKEYAKFDALKTRMKTLYENITLVPESPQEATKELQELDELWDEVCDFNDWYKLEEQRLNNMVYRGPSTFCDAHFNAISARERFLGPYTGDPWYNSLTLSEDEVVNGYHLYNTDRFPIMPRERFDEMTQMRLGTHEEEPEWTDEQFVRVFEREACSDWSKMDDHGEPFGGFWRYPEDSNERENAHDLQRKYNLDQLLKLPFSNRLKWETVVMGCETRRECVRYTNFVCVWVERKMKQMGML